MGMKIRIFRGTGRPIKYLHDRVKADGIITVHACNLCWTLRVRHFLGIADYARIDGGAE